MPQSNCPPGRDYQTWGQQQLTIFNILPQHGEATFPGRPLSGVGESRWEESEDRCYAYSCDENIGAPGAFARKYRTDAVADVLVGQQSADPELLRVLLERDGLLPIESPEDLLFAYPGAWPLAAYVCTNPPSDLFHFVRQDADGGWSDKPGPHDVRQVLAAGVLDPVKILEFEGAYQSKYSFVGFYIVDPQRLRASRPHPVELDSATYRWLQPSP